MTTRAVFALVLLLCAPAFASDEDATPDGTSVSTANSCTTSDAHTTLDDDVDGSGTDWCTSNTCTGASASSPVWHLTFTTPTNPPSTATGKIELAARARKCFTGGNDPACVFDFYCGGVLIANGTGASISSTTAQVFSETFTLDTGLCAADGSDIEARLTCTRGAAPAINRRAADVEAVEWRVTWYLERNAIVVSQSEGWGGLDE